MRIFPAAVRGWTDLLPRTRLQPDTRHRFRLTATPSVNQVRMDIYPDGGMARVRLHGELSEHARADIAARWFRLLPADQQRGVLVGDAGMSEADAVAASGLHADIPEALRKVIA